MHFLAPGMSSVGAQGNKIQDLHCIEKYNVWMSTSKLCVLYIFLLLCSFVALENQMPKSACKMSISDVHTSQPACFRGFFESSPNNSSYLAPFLLLLFCYWENPGQQIPDPEMWECQQNLEPSTRCCHMMALITDPNHPPIQRTHPFPPRSLSALRTMACLLPIVGVYLSTDGNNEWDCISTWIIATMKWEV